MDEKAEQDYSHRCLTCAHWRGNRSKQWESIREYGHKCMALNRGWPLVGDCANSCTFMNVTLHGDASVELEFDANFGCVWWETIEEQDVNI